VKALLANLRDCQPAGNSGGWVHGGAVVSDFDLDELDSAEEWFYLRRGKNLRFSLTVAASMRQ
jgi:hypothetical protein